MITFNKVSVVSQFYAVYSIVLKICSVHNRTLEIPAIELTYKNIKLNWLNISCT